MIKNETFKKKNENINDLEDIDYKIEKENSDLYLSYCDDSSLIYFMIIIEEIII